MDFKLTSDKQIRVSDLIKLADKINKEIKDMKHEEAREYTRDKYMDFCSNFPTVSDFMVEGEYSAKAFTEFLKLYYQHLSDPLNLGKVHATYPAFLAKAKNPHMGIKEFNIMAGKLTDAYEKEKAKIKEELADAAKKDRERLLDRKKELLRLIAAKLESEKTA